MRRGIGLAEGGSDGGGVKVCWLLVGGGVVGLTLDLCAYLCGYAGAEEEIGATGS